MDNLLKAHSESMTDFAPLPKLSAADHVIRRPNKQLVRLQQQIALANDSNFTLTKSKSIANNGRMKTLGEVKKRFRALVATSATGDKLLTDHYGARVIDFFRERLPALFARKKLSSRSSSRQSPPLKPASLMPHSANCRNQSSRPKARRQPNPPTLSGMMRATSGTELPFSHLARRRCALKFMTASPRQNRRSPDLAAGASRAATPCWGKKTTLCM
jgi:hypothetical protein